jgi:hypothetical protein
VFGTSEGVAVRRGRNSPPAATAGIWHVSTADDAAVLKLVAPGEGQSRWPAARDPSHPYYWRREPLVYRSGLHEPFGPPACRAICERDDGSVALWLADAGDPPTWTPELLREAATRLGRAQAETAGIGGEGVLTRGFLREYLRLHDVPADEHVLGRLDAVPHTLCHNDFHPDNVLADCSVIDWAYCGLGAPGLDAGVLVADGIADEAFSAQLADEVAAAVWAGYCDGLDGAFDEVDVRFAFVHGTALRLSWLPRGTKDAWDATIDFLQRLASNR